VTVALSGERKTECDAQASGSIQKREKELRDKFNAEQTSHLNAKCASDKARDAAIKKAQGDRIRIKEELDALGPAPTSPLQPMLTCPEPTFEGLCKLFTSGQPSLGLFSTEGGQFFGGHAMSPDNKLKTAAGLLDLWDGKAIRRVRSGDGASILPGRRLSAHLMAQPDIADILLRDELLNGQGLLSRVLVSTGQHCRLQANTRAGNRSRFAPVRRMPSRYSGKAVDACEGHQQRA
jgi:Protein of unknown function (DUF3987)